MPKPVQARVIEAVEGLRDDPRPEGHRALSSVPADMPDLYRVRVGDCRVVYAIEEDRLIVVVVTLGKRREIDERLMQLVKQNKNAARSAEGSAQRRGGKRKGG